MPVQESHLTEIEEWFERGEPLEKFRQSFSRSDNWIETKVNQPSSDGWLVLDEDRAIAFVGISVDKERVGHLNFAVKPSERGKGVGEEVVKQSLELPIVQDLREIRVLIGFDNVASEKILLHNDFSKINHNADGSLEFSRKLY